MTASKKPAKLLPCPCGWVPISLRVGSGYLVRCALGWQCKRGNPQVHLPDGGKNCFPRVIAMWNALPRRRAKAGKGARR